MAEIKHNGGTLTPFQKGKSGNPAGLPKGTKHLSTYLKLALNDTMTYKGLKRPISEVIILELIAKAVNNKSAKTQLMAISEILDRTEGKAIAKNLNINQDINQLNLSALSDQELKNLEILLNKAGTNNGAN